MSDFPIESPAPESLASLCVETLLYGCFLILFALSLYLITGVTPSTRGERHTYPKPMLCFSIFIFFLVTAHWILSVVQTFQAFVLHPGHHTAAKFLAELSQISSVLREGVLVGLFVISDLTMIYRLWSVWNHNKQVVIFPITLLFALSVFAVTGVYEFASDTLQNDQISIVGLGLSSLSINCYSAGMIIYKLCHVAKATQDWEHVSRLRFIVIILVESQSLYTIWGGIFIIFHIGLRSSISRVFIDTECPIIGITFTILHVRVGMRRLGRDAATLVSGC